MRRSRLAKFRTKLKPELKSKLRKDFSDIFVGATFHSNLDMESIIDCKHYSDVNRMYRVTPYVLRFFNNLKAKIGKSCAIDQTELQLSEINDAKTLWHHQEQKSLHSERNFDKFKKLKQDLIIGLYEVANCLRFTSRNALFVRSLKDKRTARDPLHHCRTSV